MCKKHQPKIRCNLAKKKDCPEKGFLFNTLKGRLILIFKIDLQASLKR